MEVTLSSQLREGTKESHQLAEKAPFIQKFFRGNLSRDEYSAFLLQLYYIYSAMEASQDALQGHAVLGQLHFPALHRRDALIEDLNYYLWQDE